MSFLSSTTIVLSALSFIQAVVVSGSRSHTGYTHTDLQNIITSQITDNKTYCYTGLVKEPILDSTRLLDSPATCEDGIVTGFEGSWSCSNMDLYAHISLEDLGCTSSDDHLDYVYYTGCWGNDIWGWTDSRYGTEYALMGTGSGTAIVDIEDPLEPIVVAFIESVVDQYLDKPSIWKDMKIFGDYMYVVMEASTSLGIQYVHLPTVISMAWEYYGFNDTLSVFKLAMNDTENKQNMDVNITACHNLFINEETGFMYAVGCRHANKTDYTYVAEGGLVMFDVNVSDGNPRYVGMFADDGYTHDVQCVLYNGPDNRYLNKEICFAFNEDAVTIIDVSDKSNPEVISITFYEWSMYTHQGWLDESQSFLFVDDELDEYFVYANDSSLQQPYPVTYVFDIKNLSNPLMILNEDGEPFESTTHTSIDHNHFILGNHLYQAHYEAGVRVIDVSNFLDGSDYNDWNEVGFFDTFSSADDVCFGGVWGVYPYFNSGIIAVSDTLNGLFLLKFNDPNEEETIIDNDDDDETSVSVGETEAPVVTDGNNAIDVTMMHSMSSSTIGTSMYNTNYGEENGAFVIGDTMWIGACLVIIIVGVLSV